MRKRENPFTSIYPHIDVHGEDRISCKVKVKEFINDSIVLKNNVIVIIHGKGKGILKDEIFNCLKNDRRVKKYYLDSNNNGQTIIEL